LEWTVARVGGGSGVSQENSGQQQPGFPRTNRGNCHSKQVYNQHLFGLKQALDQAEERLVQAQEQEVVVDELENRLLVLREERERDLMLIE
jgi:hypothetical protein